MQLSAIEHELALQHVGERVTTPRTFAAVSASEGRIFFRHAEAAGSGILGVHVPHRALADLNHRPMLFMRVSVGRCRNARRLRSRFWALDLRAAGDRAAKDKGVIG